jgi:AsmA protein
LKRPRISIERDHAGRFNFESPATGAKTSPALDLPKVSLSEATFVYADQRFAEKIEAEGCRLDAHDLRLPAGPRSSLLRGVSLTAELACANVRHADLMVADLKASAVAAHGVFDLQPVTATSFGAKGSGSVRADFSSAVPVYHFRYVLPQFPIEEFFKTVSQRKVATGRVDFSANLFSQGDSGKALRQSLRGEISLRGRHLTLSGGDLDKEFARFESSQRFSLVDVGAFFFVGPLGLVVTKGLNFATLLQEPTGSSEIGVLVSDWKVERGVARAQDVAMATKANRVALKGGLDFVDNRFDDLTVALIDEKGCAKVRQEVRGTFENPVVEKPGLIESLAGPALRLLKKGSEALGGGQCAAFYNGSVAAPK